MAFRVDLRSKWLLHFGPSARVLPQWVCWVGLDSHSDDALLFQTVVCPVFTSSFGLKGNYASPVTFSMLRLLFARKDLGHWALVGHADFARLVSFSQ